ncbi:MAG: glycosyltransferase [Spirochaetales bacterium]|nr:glycosyltransferase [Spirochaetales bacterium]
MKKITLVTWHGGTGGVAVLILNIVKQLKRDFSFEVCFIKRAGLVAEQIKALGIKTCILGVKSGFDINGLVKLKNFINRSSSAIIHFLYLNPLIRLAHIFSRHKNVIMSEHGCLDREKELGRWFWIKHFHRLLKNTAKMYTVPSAFSYAQIMKYKIFPRLKMRIIYNGIDLKKFSRTRKSTHEFKKKLGIPEDKTVIGTVRGLTSKMGIEHLLYAFKKLLDHTAGIVCTIIGDGPLRAKLEALAVKLAIEDKVIFFGNQSDIPLFLALMDIFVMPSVWETFGIAAAEAMAMSVPVVAYKVGALPEVIGSAGIFVDKRNPQKLAEAILTLIKDAKKRTALKQQGRKRIEKLFDIKKVANDYKQLYMQL